MRRAGCAVAVAVGLLALLCSTAEARRPQGANGGFMGVDVGGAFLLDRAHKEGLRPNNPNFGLHFGYELNLGLAPMMRVEYAPLRVEGRLAGEDRSGHYGSLLFGARYVYRWRWLAPWVGLEFGFSIFGLSGGYSDAGNPSYNFATHVSWGIDFRVANAFWIGPAFRYGHMVASSAQVNSTYLAASSPSASAAEPNNLDAFYVLFNAHLYF